MTRAEIMQIAKPILFNTDMVRAILEDRKSVTRRKIDIDIINHCDMETDGTLLDFQNEYEDFINPVKLCRYQKGDYLYIRETWSTQQSNACIGNTTGKCPYDSCETAPGPCFNNEYIYKATDILVSSVRKWHPSIHMPKEAARIFLWVTDVRVEHLQDMCADDVQKEGIYFTRPVMTQEKRKRFAELWDSTIPKKDLEKYGWAANPWVWEIQFERVEVQND